MSPLAKLADMAVDSGGGEMEPEEDVAQDEFDDADDGDTNVDGGFEAGISLLTKEFSEFGVDLVIDAISVGECELEGGSSFE